MSRPRTRRNLLLAAGPPTRSAPIPVRPGPKKARTAPGWSDWLADPRSAVLFFLASALVIGGGRKLLQGARARRAVEALGGDSPDLARVEEAADHGRAAIVDLFRLMGTADQPEIRHAAGRALAKLWAADDLIVEEEKALVRRGFAVTWRARRRYPRGLKVPIPVAASYSVPFLTPDGPGVAPSNLEWSHRILNAQRARLEEPSPWRSGPASAAFELDPTDFPGPGPHRLALAAKVRVVGLTDAWELELPHIPFSFEFDSNLALDALLTAPDETRGEALARSVRLESPESGGESSRFLDVGDFVLRDPPELVVDSILPCDLAHVLAVEFDGIPGTYRAGTVVVSGREEGAATIRIPLGPIEGLPPGAIDRPGEVRLRAVLTSDPDLGWADPDVRSLWPGTLTTGWATVRTIRR